MKAPKQVKKKPVKKVVSTPSLTLTPSVGRVKQNDVVAVEVGFTGLDEVRFTLEPKGAFTIDLNPMTKPGKLRLKGKKDGTATLVAKGMTDGAEAIRHVLHLYCEGPTVRILACGYIPFEG